MKSYNPQTNRSMKKVRTKIKPRSRTTKPFRSRNVDHSESYSLGVSPVSASGALCASTLPENWLDSVKMSGDIYTFLYYIVDDAVWYAVYLETGFNIYLYDWVPIVAQVEQAVDHLVNIVVHAVVTAVKKIAQWLFHWLHGSNDPNWLQQIQQSAQQWKALAASNPALVASFPMVTNVSGVWKADSLANKVTINGSTAYGLSMSTVYGYGLAFGIMQTETGALSAFAAHLTPEGIKSKQLPLKKADSYALEIDVDPSTGHTHFWIDDLGWDMGVLKGLKGGAHGSAVIGGASTKGDHLMACSLTDCAVASNGKWRESSFGKENYGTVGRDPHREAKLVATNGVAFHDQRSSLV
jgi:hypothetical protein